MWHRAGDAGYAGWVAGGGTEVDGFDDGVGGCGALYWADRYYDDV